MLLISTFGIALIVMMRYMGWADLKLQPTVLYGTISGGIVFGLGLAIADFCPATAVCAAGEGQKRGVITLLGGLLGAITFSLVFHS